jgi:hypothetical protein
LEGQISRKKMIRGQNFIRKKFLPAAISKNSPQNTLSVLKISKS